MMRIHYISSYVDDFLIEEYRVTPSTSAKVGYVKTALREAGFEVAMFSTVCNKSNRISKSQVLVVDGGEKHHYPFCVGGDNIIRRLISYLLIYIQLFYYLCGVRRYNETILLYHNIPDTKIVKFFNRFLGLRIILELEELYNAIKHDQVSIEKEKKQISVFPKGYIAVNSLISERCNIRKPVIVCEGQYRMVEKKRKNVLANDGKIHVLYAGVFIENSDVFASISAAAYLTDDYIMHVAGYGSESATESVVEAIHSHNETKTGCKIEYHGCLHGQKYEELLSKCSIGLCTRVLEDDLSDYTFPSKVYAYLSRNLKVICTPISCVMKSPIADSIVFTDTISPECISKAILSVDRNQVIDNKDILEQQNLRFVRELKKLF
jgi:hypothetical protein